MSVPHNNRKRGQEPSGDSEYEQKSFAVLVKDTGSNGKVIFNIKSLSINFQ